MANMTKEARTQRLMLDADTAEDLMGQGPISIRQNATLRAAVTLLTDKQVSAAPVIDDGGRPIGVISRTDIIRQVRRTADGDFDENADLPGDTTDKTLVRDMMTPAVLSVAPTASVIEVVSMMLGTTRWASFNAPKNSSPVSNARGNMCACFSACSSTHLTDSSSSTTQTDNPGVAINGLRERPANGSGKPCGPARS